MDDIHLTNKVIRFILLFNKKKTITKDDAKYLDSVRYYFMTSYLRQNGIIELDGFSTNNKKVWALTEKGRKLRDLLIKMKEVIGSG